MVWTPTKRRRSTGRQVSVADPARGEVWSVELEPTRGHEQGGTRPCLVVSADRFNQGQSGLAVVLPITSRRKGIPFHVEVQPPEGGLTTPSFIKCEDVRSVARERLVRRWGTVTRVTLAEVESRLRILLEM
jgi:mRNA interferase MazF